MNNVYIKVYDANDYLVHHGIKGQRWGIRRYQNSDGSLTFAGRARYGVRSIGKTPGDISKMINRDIRKRKAKAKVKQAEKDRAEFAKQVAKEKLKLEKEENERNKKKNVPEKTRLEKTADVLNTAANISGSISKLYENYNKVFGSKPEPSDMDKAKLELQRLTNLSKKLDLKIDDEQTRAYAKMLKKSEKKQQRVENRAERREKRIEDRKANWRVQQSDSGNTSIASIILDANKKINDLSEAQKIAAAAAKTAIESVGQKEDRFNNRRLAKKRID